MKKGRVKWRLGIHMAAIFTLVLAFCLPVYAGVKEGDGEYEIYPTPQSIEYGTGNLVLTDKVTVTAGSAIDSYTQKKIDDTLAVLGLTKVSSGAANTKLTVGVYGSGDAADKFGMLHGADEEVFAKFDAYMLWIDGSNIVILGKNTDAAYYGVTTLKRIFEQLNGKSVRNLQIQDYAEIEYRGFIEGYYGNPWSHEDRVDLMKFGGEIKMNQYVFAPKDDPYHAEQWRDLYPDTDADKNTLNHVRELAKAGNESKCFYVYALHPFKSSRPLTANTYDKDLEDLKAKFGQVIEAGVRQIAILEDDASDGGRWSADTLVMLLNDVTEWLVELKETKYPDLKTDLLFCPGWMAYANSMSGNDSDVQKIQKLHEGTGDNVRIVMTGGKIWGDVTTAFADRFYNKLAEKKEPGRYPYLWVNWPCNDNTKDSLVMGGHNNILRTNLDGSKYQGVILNPMQDSEPSKVAIFTASDFCWKIWKDTDEGDQAWDDAFKYIDHMTPISSESSDALREIAKHMITQSPGQAGKQGEFDESVEIKDKLAAFRSKLTAGNVQLSDVEEMKAIFGTINDAINFYMQEGTNRRMAAQLTPYAGNLRDVTQADLYLLDALESILNDDKSAVYDGFSAAQACYETSKTYSFTYVDIIVTGQGGRKYIQPFTEQLMEYVSDAVKQIVSPDDDDTVPPTKYRAELSYTEGWTIHEGDVGNVTDGNDSTYTWFNPSTTVRDVSLAGDYIQLDLGEAKTVGNVRALVGSPGSGDKWTRYHLEYSQDGENWTALDSYTGSGSDMDTYVADLRGALARYIRLVNDVDINKWVQFSEFAAYSYVGGNNGPVYTNTDDESWEANMGEDSFALLAKEGASLPAGGFVGLKLDRIHEITDITVTGTGIEGLVLEKSVNAKEWTASKNGSARYIRLMNKGGQAVNFNLDTFVVSSKEIWPIDFMDSNISIGSSSEDARSIGTTRNWVDGDLNTAAKYTNTPAAGSYVTYDLGQEIDIRSLKVWTKVGTYDYPRAAKFQASLTSGDDADWQDILVIDGDSSSASFSISPEENGWTPGEGAVEVAYAYREAKNITPVRARYLRLYFTAANGGRWAELYEIEINDGEFIPSINDPTFDMDFELQKGIVMQHLNDNDFTTAFKPEGVTKGSVVYHLSEERGVGRINILQSGASICNATVSVRTGADTWEELGTLDRSYTAFYTADLENVYDIKLEWDGVVPTIYEIITLKNAGDVLESNIQAAQKQLDAADAKVAQAQEALNSIAAQITAAETKVNAAANVQDKLVAEVELYKLYAKRASAESDMSEKKAVSAVCSAKVARAQARKYKAEDLADEAAKKEAEAINKLQEADAQQKLAQDKKAEQTGYEQKAKDKQEELDKLLNTPNPPGTNPPSTNPPANEGDNKDPQPVQPEVKSFKTKSLKYKVVSASAKTVTVTGPVKKSITSAVIPAAVTYKGVSYKVVQISNSAFKNCSKLRKVTIGSNVKKIGKQAFSGCGRLKDINMKKASKITSFGTKAFNKINTKAKVTVPAKKLKKYKSALKKAGLPKKATVKK
jgi:hypothetical protein